MDRMPIQMQSEFYFKDEMLGFFNIPKLKQKVLKVVDLENS